MWRWLIVTCVVNWSWISSLPVTEDGSPRLARQFDFIECCPCPKDIDVISGEDFEDFPRTESKPSTQDHLPFETTSRGSNGGFTRDPTLERGDLGYSDLDALPEESRAGVVVAAPERAVADCPCRSRDADTRAAASRNLQSKVFAIRPDLMRAFNSKDNPKPLLHPEVDLASSVLETIREATDEEYRDALARDAARNEARSSDDGAPSSSRNIVTIILAPPPSGKPEDDFLGQGTHIHESRRIETPIGKVRSKTPSNISPLPTMIRDLLGMPTQSSRSSNNGIAHDLDSGASASEVKEQRLARPKAADVISQDSPKERDSFFTLPNMKPLSETYHNVKDKAIKLVQNLSSKIPTFNQHTESVLDNNKNNLENTANTPEVPVVSSPAIQSPESNDFTKHDTLPSSSTTSEQQVTSLRSVVPTLKIKPLPSLLSNEKGLNNLRSAINLKPLKVSPLILPKDAWDDKKLKLNVPLLKLSDIKNNLLHNRDDSENLLWNGPKLSDLLKTVMFAPTEQSTDTSEVTATPEKISEPLPEIKDDDNRIKTEVLDTLPSASHNIGETNNKPFTQGQNDPNNAQELFIDDELLRERDADDTEKKDLRDFDNSPNENSSSESEESTTSKYSNHMLNPAVDATIAPSPGINDNVQHTPPPEKHMIKEQFPISQNNPDAASNLDVIRHENLKKTHSIEALKSGQEKDTQTVDDLKQKANTNSNVLAAASSPKESKIPVSDMQGSSSDAVFKSVESPRLAKPRYNSRGVLDSLLRQDGIVQPLPLFDSFSMPHLDLENLLRSSPIAPLPSLDEIRSRVQNFLRTSGFVRDSDDSSDLDDDSNIQVPLIAKPQSRKPVSSSLKPTEEVDLDIFRVRPPVTRLSQRKPANLGDLSRGLNFDTIKARLHVPAKAIKPLKLQSSIGKDGGLLGARLSIRPKKKTVALKKSRNNLIASPSKRIVETILPSLDSTRSAIESRTKDMLDRSRSILTNVPPPTSFGSNGLQSLDDVTSNLRADASKIQQSLRSAIGDSLPRSSDILGTPLLNKDDVLETLTKARSQIDDRLREMQSNIATTGDKLRSSLSGSVKKDFPVLRTASSYQKPKSSVRNSQAKVSSNTRPKIQVTKVRSKKINSSTKTPPAKVNIISSGRNSVNVSPKPKSTVQTSSQQFRRPGPQSSPTDHSRLKMPRNKLPVSSLTEPSVPQSYSTKFLRPEVTRTAPTNRRPVIKELDTSKIKSQLKPLTKDAAGAASESRLSKIFPSRKLFDRERSEVSNDLNNDDDFVNAASKKKPKLLRPFVKINITSLDLPAKKPNIPESNLRLTSNDENNHHDYARRADDVTRPTVDTLDASRIEALRKSIRDRISNSKLGQLKKDSSIASDNETFREVSSDDETNTNPTLPVSRDNLLSKIRGTLKDRLLSSDKVPSKLRDIQPNPDMLEGASQKQITAMGPQRGMKENVKYKCKMICEVDEDKKR